MNDLPGTEAEREPMSKPIDVILQPLNMESSGGRQGSIARDEGISIFTQAYAVATKRLQAQENVDIVLVPSLGGKQNEKHEYIPVGHQKSLDAMILVTRAIKQAGLTNHALPLVRLDTNMQYLSGADAVHVGDTFEPRPYVESLPCGMLNFIYEAGQRVQETNNGRGVIVWVLAEPERVAQIMNRELGVSIDFARKRAQSGTIERVMLMDGQCTTTIDGKPFLHDIDRGNN
jgi:hypothetical protein